LLRETNARVYDIHVHTGADAVNFNYSANQIHEILKVARSRNL
jgi:hypothetical protein